MVDYLKIIDVTGKAEVSEARSSVWKPLKAARKLSAGVQLRTHTDSTVEISTSFDHSGLMRLGEEAWLEVTAGDLCEVSLKSGVLMVLREEDGNATWPPKNEERAFEISTPDAVISLFEGGCSVVVSAKGTWVRVFGGHVSVAGFAARKGGAPSTVVREGHKFFLRSNSKPATTGPFRMNYHDYTPWKLWIRRCYQRKDDRVIDVFKTRGIL